MSLQRHSTLRRTRLKPCSKKRAAKLSVYAVQRMIFLAHKPICQACIVRKSSDVHHTHGRVGDNMLNTETWMAVCRRCHDWIHAHPKEARSKGWLL